MRKLLVVAIASVACGSFGTSTSTPPGDAGNASIDASGGSADGGKIVLDGSAPPTCTVNTTCSSCKKYDFEGQPCPITPDWDLFTNGAATIACQAGRLRLAAANTDDATASVSMQSPSQFVGARVELRFSLARWTALQNPARVLGGGTDESDAVVVTAIENASSDFELAVCRFANKERVDCMQLATIPKRTDHVLMIDWSAAGAVVTLDCTASVIQPKVTPIPPNDNLQLEFGTNDGAPAEGTIDDVVMYFR